MKIRVLGCSGAIARNCRTTSFLIDDVLLVDAGTGVGDLTLAEMQAIDDVFLTHSHLDHIAALPLMVDAVASMRTQPLRVHGLTATIEALQRHVFNDLIWPDFTRIPSASHPFMMFHALAAGSTVAVGNKIVEALPAVHTVPAVGYAVSTADRCWVFSGDTERNPAFWQRVNQLPVNMLVVETAFSNREKDLAHRSLHLSPSVLADELDQLAEGRHFPIYITHTKPAETTLIMQEVQAFDRVTPAGRAIIHDIRWLSAGQVFEL